MIGERNRHPLRAIVESTELPLDFWRFRLSCGHTVYRYKQSRAAYATRKVPRRCRCATCHALSAPLLEPSPFDPWT